MSLQSVEGPAIGDADELVYEGYEAKPRVRGKVKPLSKLPGPQLKTEADVSLQTLKMHPNMSHGRGSSQ